MESKGQELMWKRSGTRGDRASGDDAGPQRLEDREKQRIIVP